jgi:glycosyltransferase involved in cell wall biosynthesis
MTPFKVDISVGSRFHAFDLARELDERGALRYLHTGYPAFSANRFRVNPDAFRSVWTHEPCKRFIDKLIRLGLIPAKIEQKLSDRFDRIVASQITEGASIFVGWSGFCRQSLKVAKKNGMRTIVERGSTHILWQFRTLTEEAARTGLRVALPSKETIEAELEEYEIADYIAVPSSFAAQTFIEQKIKPEKILKNPYGVDIKKYAVEPRRAGDKKLRIIHVGRCSVQKGVHYLTEAVESTSDCYLTFVGALDPGIRESISKSKTTIVGPVPSSQLAGFYNRSDVFCLASLQEGMALVIAQAMACGLPVIITPNTGGQELVTDGIEGFIVPARDPDAIASKLELLRDDPKLRQEMGRRARMRIESGYSWRDYGSRAIRNYEEVVRATPMTQFKVLDGDPLS